MTEVGAALAQSVIPREKAGEPVRRGPSVKSLKPGNTGSPGRAMVEPGDDGAGCRRKRPSEQPAATLP